MARPEHELGCHGPLVTVRWLDGRPSARLSTDEYGYEQDAAIVLARRGSRFRVALSSGSVWVEADRSLYRPAVTLMREGLLGLEPGAPPMRQSPGGAPLAVRADDSSGSGSVRLLAIATLRGRLWLKVRFEEICAEPGPLAAPREGWLPFRGADGRPAVWFASRGC